METLFGSIIWKHYLEALFGSIIWKRYLEALFGSVIWKRYLEALFGSIIWKRYLEALFGSVIWKRYLEALGIFQCLRKRLLESFEVFEGFLIHLALSTILSSNNANRLSIIFKQGRMENKGS